MMNRWRWTTSDEEDSAIIMPRSPAKSSTSGVDIDHWSDVCCNQHTQNSVGKDGESQYPILQFPGNINRQNTQSSSATSLRDFAQNSLKKNGDGTISTENNSLAPLNNQSSVMGASNFSRATSLSSQLLAQRKIFAESQTGMSSFRKLLEPSLHQCPGIAPNRVVLGNIKDKLMKIRRRLELFLEDLPCEHDPMEYYETTYQLLEPLLLCYDSLVAPKVKEVLDTFCVAAELGSDSPGAYVISMASNASDVLAVELLQKDIRLAVSGELERPCPGGI